VTRLVVIGVGNPWRRDDGVGPTVVDALRGRFPGVRLAVCDGEPTTLIDLWSGADLAVVVDAARGVAGGAGTIHRLGRCGRTLGGPVGTHAVDLGDAVALARALDRLPAALLLYAVQVEDVRPGFGLSPAVAAAVHRLAAELARLLDPLARPGPTGAGHAEAPNDPGAAPARVRGRVSRHRGGGHRPPGVRR
jgi:hydrogenase maturation protease